MNEPPKEMSTIRRLLNAFAKGWISQVPDDIACCEFNCRESQCEQGTWETCENRLRFVALAKRGPNESSDNTTSAGLHDKKAD